MLRRAHPVWILVLVPLLPWPAAEGDDEREPTGLDFAYYRARVAPIVHRICAECHADPRKRLGRHLLRPAFGREPSGKDHERNFRTIRELIEAGNPAASRWLLKPLGPEQGGMEHGGGRRIRFDGIEYATMVDFINGATLPPPRSADPARSPSAEQAPEVPPGGLVLQAEALERVQDLIVQDDANAEGGRLVVPGEGGGHATLTFRIPGDATWQILLRIRGPGDAVGVRLDRGEPEMVAAGRIGFQEVGPLLLLDGVDPLAPRRGGMHLDGEALALRGRNDAPAGFLCAALVDHQRLEAQVDLPSEEEGGDDALVLFDADDLDNAPFAGLTDGGRRFVLGVREGGVTRALTNVRLASPAIGSHRIRVDLLDGVAVGRLDDRALAFAHLDMPLGRGRFGILTHGALRVRGLGAHDRWAVHQTSFREEPAARLDAGPHVLRIELPPSGPALDRVTIRRLPDAR